MLWVSVAGVVGVQRKTLDDLLTSAEDGRLGQQVSQMQALDAAWLVLEGKVRWLGDGGPVVARGGRARDWTIGQLRALLWSVMARGIMVDRTESLDDTIAWVKGCEAWSQKDKHQSLLKRGPVPRDVLGTVTNRERAIFLHMGLPGVGPEMAGRLVDAGGVIGLRDGMTLERLMEVPGMGKGRVEKIMGVLSP